MSSHTATIPASSATVAPRSIAGRATYAVLAALFVAAIVVESMKNGTDYRQIAGFALAPDVALLFGVGSGLAKGQLHPRAVGLYNLTHRFWGPAALLALAVTGLVPFGFSIGALVWSTHIAGDRALGYGLRTRAGFQRP